MCYVRGPLDGDSISMNFLTQPFSRVEFKIEQFPFVMLLNRMNALAACCHVSVQVHWLFPLSARETSLGKRSIHKSTRERVAGFQGLV